MTRPHGGWLAKLTAILVLVSTLLSLAAIASRGPWIASIAIFVALFWLMDRGRIPTLLFGVLLSVISIPFIVQIYEALLNLRPDLTTFEAVVLSDSRLYIWQISFNILKDPLILGIGPGMFLSMEINYPTTSFVFESAHQLYLTLGIETGLIGLGAFLVIVFLVGWHSYRAIRSLEDSHYKRALQIVALGLLGFIVVSLTTGMPFKGREEGLAAGLIPWALAGLLMGTRRASEDLARKDSPMPVATGPEAGLSEKIRFGVGRSE
jgi:O-antigen ligase